MLKVQNKELKADLEFKTTQLQKFLKDVADCNQEIYGLRKVVISREATINT